MVYGYRAARKNGFKGVYFASERRLDLMVWWSYHCFGFFDFSKLSFLFKIFWMAILKSERFFSSVNRWSGKDFGSSIGVLHEAFKIAHTYTSFWRKFLWIRDSFCIMILGFSPYFNAYYAERKFCHRYTHALSPVWNRPPYMRVLYARKIPPRYIWKIAARQEWCVRDWLALASWRLFVLCFIYAVIVWIGSFLLIGWCQSLVVKAW